MLIFSPIKNLKNIDYIVKNCECRNFYINYNKNFNNNFTELYKSIYTIHEHNSKIYINFKNYYTDKETEKIKTFINHLKNSDIDGIITGSLDISEIANSVKFNKEIIINSSFDAHNIETVNLIKNTNKINAIIITEEIYINNLIQIKNNTNCTILIKPDNLPWIIDDILNSNAVNGIFIEGIFKNEKNILKSINIVEDLINKSPKYKNKKLPFKNTESVEIETKHFTKEVIVQNGNGFKFKNNIKKFKCHETGQKVYLNNFSNKKVKNIYLKLTSLSQLEYYNSYINKYGIKPITAIEFGEIIDTKDLSKNNFREIIKEANNFCKKHKIILKYSTPKILTERDFDRYYSEMVNLIKEEKINTIVINNLGLLNRLSKENFINNKKLEIGTGIKIHNSMAIKYLSRFINIYGIDFSELKNRNNIESCIKSLPPNTKTKKITILGNKEISCKGLCPLNDKPANISRITCNAPCRNGIHTLRNPYTNEEYPFIADGFCRMHVFKDIDYTDYVKELSDIGINEFILDISIIEGYRIEYLLNSLLNSINNI